MSRRALILSSSFDSANFRVVARRLREAGYDVVELLSDEVLAGRQKLAVEFHDGVFACTIGDGLPFHPDEIGAAWWRKPQWSNVVRQDAAQRISVELELERMHLALASLVPANSWLNSPKAMHDAESKLRQLEVAARVGLKCPDTLVANDWEAVRKAFGSREIVYKALRGQVRTAEEDRVVFTRRIDPGSFAKPVDARPYPGLFQTLVHRRREWRITVVDDSVFPVAIYTPEGAVDWRKDQLRGDARFAVEEIDANTQRALIALVAELGLRYAAIDLIETPSGEIVFLEANANGQYSWLETELGLPISEAIASALGAN